MSENVDQFKSLCSQSHNRHRLECKLKSKKEKLDGVIG